MAAGLGYKEFATGDVLTAAAANGYLASQVVMVFADAAARTAAITSPQEGMFSYLKDTNATEYYTGSAWTAIGGGGLSSPLTTKGDVWGYSTTNARVPVGTNGQVLTADSTNANGVTWSAPSAGALTLITSGTLSGSSTTFTNCFSSTYDAYVVIFSKIKNSSGGTIRIELTGETNSYKGSLLQIASDGTPSAAVNNNGANPWIGGNVSSDDVGSSAWWDIAFRGSSGRKFESFWKSYYGASGGVGYYGALQAATYAAMTGFTVSTSTGTWSDGNVAIYGVAK
jgi:hypothetical protein